jgi:perosamine synthetase
MIRLTRPSIDADDLEAVQAVVRSGQLVQGPAVAEFERAIMLASGTSHAIAVTNATSALHMALLALGVQAGDLVVVTAYSWPTTANVIELCGAQPVFVDVDPLTGNMSPDALGDTLRRLTRAPGNSGRIKAILPVHTFGQLCDMSALMAIATEFGLPLIEDAACALGADSNGQRAGSWGTMGCFSFHPRKAVTTGEGGAIVTNDAQLARWLRAARNHGQDAEFTGSDPFVMPGFNNRMTEFQGALGVTQMHKLDRVVSARRTLAARYDATLSPELSRTAPSGVGTRHVYQSYVVLLPAAVAPRRAQLIKELREAGVEAQIGTWHMPLITYYRARYGYRAGDFPQCDAFAQRALTLPLYEGMTHEEQNTVVAAVHSISGITSAAIA